MIFKDKIYLYKKFILVVLFIVLILFLGLYHMTESIKNPPIAKTDKTEYNVNEKILLKIDNRLPQQIVMRGCEVFIIQEQKENGDWINSFGKVVCSRDEIIRVFSKRSKIVDFIPKKIGKYRIFVAYKMYRREDQKGDNDKPSYLPKLYSNDFNVR